MLPLQLTSSYKGNSRRTLLSNMIGTDFFQDDTVLTFQLLNSREPKRHTFVLRNLSQATRFINCSQLSLTTIMSRCTGARFPPTRVSAHAQDLADRTGGSSFPMHNSTFVTPQRPHSDSASLSGTSPHDQPRSRRRQLANREGSGRSSEYRAAWSSPRSHELGTHSSPSLREPTTPASTSQSARAGLTRLWETLDSQMQEGSGSTQRNKSSADYENGLDPHQSRKADLLRLKRKFEAEIRDSKGALQPRQRPPRPPKRLRGD